MGVDQGTPPSYASIFGELKAHKEASTGNVDFAKKAKDSVAARCGGVCCLIFALLLIGAFLLALPIAEIVIGSTRLDDCPAQKYLPIYLIVSGVFGVLSGIGSCGGCAKSHRSERHEEGEGETGSSTGSKVGSCCNSLIGTFLFAWFICGNVWVFRMQPCEDPVTNTSTGCFTHSSVFSNTTIYCDETLYKFVFWESVAKWIVTGVFVVFGCLCCLICCCVCCCSSKSDETK